MDAGLLPLRLLLLNYYQIDVPDDGDAELNTILESVYLTEGYRVHSLSCVDPHWSFDQLLEKCQIHLLKTGVKENVLIQGLSAGENGAQLHASSSMTATHMLKRYAWRRLHSVIGSYVMTDILMMYSAFQSTESGFIQLFGDTLKKSFTYKRPQTVRISLDRWLYKLGYQRKNFIPIPSSKQDFLQTVFKSEYRKISPSKVPSKLKFFGKLAQRAIKNHTHCRYLPIFDQICTEPAETDNLDRCINRKDVIRFCTVIFDKVIPLQMYGSKSNKSVILKNLSCLVLGNKGSFIEIDHCIKDIKMLDICWLGKSYSGKLNKQDTTKRNGLLKQFISWLFMSFFPRLIASFFHVTHISSSKELLFYRHATWTSISNPFINEYKAENLLPVQGLMGITQSDSAAVLRCTSRVMPKKNNDFRVINVPSKGKDLQEKRDYLNHLFDEIRPAKRIINKLRLSKKTFFPHLTSLDQIPVHIGRFKKKLFEEYGMVPKLYFLKFDAKTAYDTLPQKKIFEIIDSMITDDECYTLCEETELGLDPGSGSKVSRHLKTLTQLKDRNLQHRSQPVLQSLSKSDSMKGSEIKEVSKIQIAHSVTRLGGLNYTRRIGVFQGIHLSSLFCDLVYESLIMNELAFLDKTESLVLRIADDFLIISSDSETLLKARQLVNQGFPEYGLRTNKLKTAVNFSSQEDMEFSSSFSFCGFQIDVVRLDVIKLFDKSMIYSANVKSHSEAIKKLFGLFKVRSSYNTLNISLNSFESILKQVEILISNISQSYYQCTRKIEVNDNLFADFVKQIEGQIVIKLGPVTYQMRSIAIDTIRNTFLRELQKKNTKYHPCIRYLHELSS
jgi:telomerase reverse transcriptase